jgi:hypothetical protein
MPLGDSAVHNVPDFGQVVQVHDGLKHLKKWKPVNWDKWKQITLTA